MAPHRFTHRPAQVAGDRDHRQADVDEGVGILLDEGGGFQGGEKHLAPLAFTACVVEDGILPGHACRRLGIAGVEHRPDLRTDGGAFFIDEVVLEAAGHGRAQAPRPIAHEEAVLVPGIRGGIGCPGLAELRNRGIAPIRLQGLQPDQLQIQIIVRRGNRGHRIIIGEVELLASAFVGSAKRSADVLAQPAGMDLVLEINAGDDEGRGHGDSDSPILASPVALVLVWDAQSLGRDARVVFCPRGPSGPRKSPQAAEQATCCRTLPGGQACG